MAGFDIPRSPEELRIYLLECREEATKRKGSARKEIDIDLINTLLAQIDEGVAVMRILDQLFSTSATGSDEVAKPPMGFGGAPSQPNEQAEKPKQPLGFQPSKRRS